MAAQHKFSHSSELVYNWSYFLTGPIQHGMTPGGYISPTFTTSRHKMQHELWRIWASTDDANFSSPSSTTSHLMCPYRV